jgi:putative transposase
VVKAMGIEGISESEMSRMATELDSKVTESRNCPLDGGHYRYLLIDLFTQRVKKGGGVNAALRLDADGAVWPGLMISIRSHRR